MGGVDRFAGESVEAIVDRFMAIEPRPKGVSEAEWLTEKQNIRDRIISWLTRPGSDPRDRELEPGLWRSQTLPMGVSIDQAVKDGVW